MRSIAPAITAAPPSACTQRAAMSTASDGASAHASEAAANVTRPAPHVALGSLRTTRAAGRIAAARTTLKAVSTQETPNTVVSKRRRMSGSASVTTDESASTMPTVAASRNRCARRSELGALIDPWTLGPRRLLRFGRRKVRVAAPHSAHASGGPTARGPQEGYDSGREQCPHEKGVDHETDSHRERHLVEGAHRDDREKREGAGEHDAGRGDREGRLRPASDDGRSERLPRLGLAPDAAGEEDAVVGAEREQEDRRGEWDEEHELALAEQTMEEVQSEPQRGGHRQPPGGHEHERREQRAKEQRHDE